MANKLIGLTSSTSETQHRLNTAYFDAFNGLGSLVVALPVFSIPSREHFDWQTYYNLFKDKIDDYADKLDGLVLTGGVDLNPDTFEEGNYGSGSCDTIRDFMEMSLFHAFKERNKPIMGICRGHQLIGNALGLSPLFQQDLDTSELGEVHTGTSLDLKHRQETAHRVEVFGDFRKYISEACQKDVTNISVNSWHHQGFTLTVSGKAPKLPNNVSFPTWRTKSIQEMQKAFDITVLSASRFVIEAISYNGFKIYSVQWHPEEYGPNSLTIKYWFDKYF